MTRLVRDGYSVRAFLDMLESWLRISAFGYRRGTTNGVQKFVIQHDMGGRWSTYFEKLIEYVFEYLDEEKPSFGISDNAVSFRIK